MVTASMGSNTKTRNSSFFKRSPSSPEDHSDEDESDDLEDPQVTPNPAARPDAPIVPAMAQVNIRPQRERRLPGSYTDFIM